MRLSPTEHQAIKSAVSNIDPQAKIYLYGSRIDDDKRGGDIDLLIISQTISTFDITKIRLKLFDKIGEQKIDIIKTTSVDESPFISTIIKEAICL